MIQQSAGAGGYLKRGRPGADGPRYRAADVVTREDHDEGALRRAVDFARLLSLSSLGTQEALADRQTGRREIEAREARLRGVLGEDCVGAVEADDEEHAFAFAVAEALELRGYTFEAELRFHRLVAHPQAALRLAQLLESKGFAQEATELYLRGSRGGQSSASFRLAVMSWRDGDLDRSRRLVRTGWAEMDPELRAAVVVGLRDLDRLSTPDGGGPPPLPWIESPASAYALATTVLVGAGRVDVARLAYCSATASGSTLAALSLLELGGTDPDPLEQAHRRQLLERGARHLDDEPAELPDDVDALLGAARRPELRRSTADLVRLAREELRAERAERRGGAMARLVNLLHTVTFLWAYARVGCSEVVRAHVERAAARASLALRQAVESEQDVAELLGELVGLVRRELVSDEDLPRREGLLHAGHPRDLALEDGAKRGFPASGAVHRLHREFRLFEDDQLTVVVLHLAGMGSHEIATTVRSTDAKVQESLRLSLAQLHAGQSGEHRHHRSVELLWAAVESCFDEHPEEVL